MHPRQMGLGSQIGRWLAVPLLRRELQQLQIFFLPSRGHLVRGPQCRTPSMSCKIDETDSPQSPGFFSIVSEMRDPRQYASAMLVCQAGVTAVYAIVGCIIYYYCGTYVSSPALGSAGGTIKIISYAFAIPGLFVSMTIVTHVSSKVYTTGVMKTAHCFRFPDPSKIHFCSRVAWFPSPHQQYSYTLAKLAWLYPRYHSRCMDHC